MIKGTKNPQKSTDESSHIRYIALPIDDKKPISVSWAMGKQEFKADVNPTGGGYHNTTEAEINVILNDPGNCKFVSADSHYVRDGVLESHLKKEPSRKSHVELVEYGEGKPWPLGSSISKRIWEPMPAKDWNLRDTADCMPQELIIFLGTLRSRTMHRTPGCSVPRRKKKSTTRLSPV